MLSFFLLLLIPNVPRLLSLFLSNGLLLLHQHADRIRAAARQPPTQIQEQLELHPRVRALLVAPVQALARLRRHRLPLRGQPRAAQAVGAIGHGIDTGEGSLVAVEDNSGNSLLSPNFSSPSLSSSSASSSSGAGFSRANSRPGSRPIGSEALGQRTPRSRRPVRCLLFVGVLVLLFVTERTLL